MNRLVRLEWAILAYGALLRLTQYLSNRSLWLDESMLSLNIIHRNFAELLRPLDYNQGAPVGFLMLQKALVSLFGPGEYALRLLPFLCGLASLFLFYYLAKKCLERNAVPMALALFAMVLPLIYYSSEAKQYSGDAAVTLCLLSVAVSYLSSRLTFRRILLLGLLGAVSVWLSHPAVFVLAGIGGSVLLSCAVEKRWPDIARLSVGFALWLLSFAICYFVSFRSLAANQMLLGYWSFSFPPSQPFSVAGVEWLIGTFFQMFQSPVGLDLSGVAALGFLVGSIYIYRKQKQTFAILTLPILLTLAAAALHKYPFSGRLLLFAVPALLLLVAEGAQQIWVRTRTQSPVIGAGFVGLLFLYPVLFSAYHLLKPQTHEEIKPVLNYIREHQRADDLLYVDKGAGPAFSYYEPRFDFPAANIVLGGVWQDYPKDLDRLAGARRVWLVLAHLDHTGAIDEQVLLLNAAGARGKRLDSFAATGAATYLYEFSLAATPSHSR